MLNISWVNVRRPEAVFKGFLGMLYCSKFTRFWKGRRASASRGLLSVGFAEQGYCTGEGVIRSSTDKTHLVHFGSSEPFRSRNQQTSAGQLLLKDNEQNPWGVSPVFSNHFWSC
jgi:hypothetical protein